MADGDEADEAPLDPAVERVRRKLVRMLAVTMAVTFLGLMAVVAGVVYRVAGSAPAPVAPVAPGDALALDLAPGAAILDMALDGERALLRAGGPDGESLLLLDLPSGAIVGRYRLAPAP